MAGDCVAAFGRLYRTTIGENSGQCPPYDSVNRSICLSGEVRGLDCAEVRAG